MILFHQALKIRYKERNMSSLTNRQKQAAKTREKIFLTAMSLLAEKSYEKVSVSDICKEAHVSVGAFYHHFENKQSIINEGYKIFDEDLKDSWNKENIKDNFQAIKFLVSKQLESMEKFGPRISAQFFKTQINNKVKYMIEEDRFFFQTIFDLTSNEVENGNLIGDPREITRDILSISRGIIYDWCLHEGDYKLVEKGIRTLEMVLQFYGKA